MFLEWSLWLTMWAIIWGLVACLWLGLGWIAYQVVKFWAGVFKAWRS